MKECEDEFAVTGMKATFEGSQTPAQAPSEDVVWSDGDSAGRKSWTSKDFNDKTITATGDKKDSGGRHSTGKDEEGCGDVEAMRAVDSLSVEDLTVSNREHVLFVADTVKLGTDCCKEKETVLSVADGVKEGTAVLSAVDSCKEEKSVLSFADSCKAGIAVESAVDISEEEKPVLSFADSCKEGTAVESGAESCEEEKSVLSVTDSCKMGTAVESVASSCWQVPILSCGQLPPTSCCIANGQLLPTSCCIASGQLPHHFQLKSGGLMAIPPYYPRPKKGM
jgi:hypothetical protein